MICCIQRVSEASVKIDGAIVGEIGAGLLVLFGVEKGDDPSYTDWMSEKIANLRIFEDENGKMSRSLLDIGGSVLIVSQFTLAGDASKGRRPDFYRAEVPNRAKELYEKFISSMKSVIGEDKMASGVFGADMDVALINNGPVTILLEKRK